MFRDVLANQDTLSQSTLSRAVSPSHLPSPLTCVLQDHVEPMLSVSSMIMERTVDAMLASLVTHSLDVPPATLVNPHPVVPTLSAVRTVRLVR